MRLTLAATGVLLAPSLLPAQNGFELSYRYREADQCVAAGDVNKDGHPDLLVGARNRGYVALISGKDFRPIQTWNEPVRGSGFGASLLIGDFDQDKVPDYIVGAPSAQQGKGAVFVISGKTNVVTMQIIGDGGGFGTTMCLADVKPFFPDGKQELFVGAPSKSLASSTSYEGQVRIFEYSNGTSNFIGKLDGSGNRANFGTAMASNGDLDGKPGDDVVITAKGYYSSFGGCGGGYLEVVSGGTISVKRTNGPSRVCFGRSLLIDDLDADRKKEILVGCGFNNRTSVAYLYEQDTNNNWTQKVTFTPKSGTRNLGIESCRIPDRNSDGVDDIAILGSEGVEFWSGRSYLPLEHFKSKYMTSIAYVGDLDRDNQFEIIVGNASDGYPTWETSLQVWSKKQWPLRPLDNYVSATRGGRIDIELRLDKQRAGELYMVLGNVTGTSPGIRLPGAGTLPLNIDPFLTFMLNAMNVTPFINFVGFVGNDGTAKATWQSAGNLGAYAPLRMHFAALTIDYKAFKFTSVTNARHFVVK